MKQKSKEEIIAEQNAKRKEWWETHLEPFKEPYDVPNLPIVDKFEWETFYVPILIKRGAIPKDKLEIGTTYIGECRNASEAIWLGEHFEYQRHKFGFTYPEKINHFQDDNGFDLFVPIRKKEVEEKDGDK